MGVRAPEMMTLGSQLPAVIASESDRKVSGAVIVVPFNCVDGQKVSTSSPRRAPIEQYRSNYANIVSMMSAIDLKNSLGSLILSIDHVGIAVPDLAEALNFYQGILGAEPVHQETNTEQGVNEVMLRFAHGETEIQLLEPLGPDTTIGKFIANKGPGIQQIAFRVSDIRAVAEHLSGAGIRMLYAEPRIGTAGSLVNFAHPKDCLGVLCEFVQPA